MQRAGSEYDKPWSMETAYKQCQSCGMPLWRDLEGGGSEQDGSRSQMYCSSCYRDGAFIQPELSVQEMQRLVDDILKREMRWWKVFRWLAVRQIPTLARWRK
jgi:hypothetical protein